MPVHDEPKQVKESNNKATKAAAKDAAAFSGILSTDQQVAVAKEAWDRQLEKSLTWDELDGQTQGRYVDISVDITRRGAPSSAYEQSVAEVWGEVLAGTYVPPPPDPEVFDVGAADLQFRNEQDRERQIREAWIGATTEAERERRREVDERLKLAEERVQKATKEVKPKK
jgi:hypothetical protein